MIYLIIFSVLLAFDFIFAELIVNVGSNYKLQESFWYYFFITLFFSPLFAMLIAILDVLTMNKKNEDKKT